MKDIILLINILAWYLLVGLLAWLLTPWILLLFLLWLPAIKYTKKELKGGKE